MFLLLSDEDSKIQDEIEETLYELEQKYNIWIKYEWNYKEE